MSTPPPLLLAAPTRLPLLPSSPRLQAEAPPRAPYPWRIRWSAAPSTSSADRLAGEPAGHPDGTVRD